MQPTKENNVRKNRDRKKRQNQRRGRVAKDRRRRDGGRQVCPWLCIGVKRGGGEERVHLSFSVIKHTHIPSFTQGLSDILLRTLDTYMLQEKCPVFVHTDGNAGVFTVGFKGRLKPSLSLTAAVGASCCWAIGQRHGIA